jgi:hypothetical protein
MPTKSLPKPPDGRANDWTAEPLNEQPHGNQLSWQHWVDTDRHWGPQTECARRLFLIGTERFPLTTRCEARTMVAARVMGNHVTVTIGTERLQAGDHPQQPAIVPASDGRGEGFRTSHSG